MLYVLGITVRYINNESDSDGNTYMVQQEGPTSSFPKIKCLGAADPKDFFLPGFQGSYGDPSDGKNAKNFSKWGETLEDNSSYDNSDIEKIAVSFPFLTKTYQSMADKTKTVGGFKQSVKIAEFLKAIFDRLENLTGGLITLSAVPWKDKLPLTPDNQSPPFDITIMNKKMIQKPSVPKPFVFKTLAKKSITKAVSLSSEFDSDYILMATKANIEKGTSTGQYLLKDPHGGPYPVNPKEKPEEQEAIDDSTLLDMRNKMGDKGASPERITGYGDACRAYILQNSKKDPKLKEGRYGEIQYTLNLSVTIDGVWKIPYLAPIKIDRLPEIFNTKGVIFSIIGVNHEFDGKGGWETSLETVMRIP